MTGVFRLSPIRGEPSPMRSNPSEWLSPANRRHRNILFVHLWLAQAGVVSSDVVKILGYWIFACGRALFRRAIVEDRAACRRGALNAVCRITRQSFHHEVVRLSIQHQCIAA